MVRTSSVVVFALIAITVAGLHASAGQAAPATKPITNADIISMSTVKLSDDVVIGSIQQASTAEFDVSPAGLIALRSAGVSDRVLQSMQARVNGAPKQDAGGIPPFEPCGGIFVTEEDPPSRTYVVVKKEVQAGKKFYGAHDDNLMLELAMQARKSGADAIIKFHEWRAPSMWSWAAAKAGGMAVKWTAEGKAGISAMKGQCWSPNVRD